MILKNRRQQIQQLRQLYLDLDEGERLAIFALVEAAAQGRPYDDSLPGHDRITGLISHIRERDPATAERIVSTLDVR